MTERREKDVSVDGATYRIWEQFSERLRRFILARVANQHDAEDILQDVFLKVHRGIGGLKRRDRVESWIYQIARNAIVDHYRRRGVRAETAVLPSELPTARDEPDDGDTALAELSRCVRPMIDALPDAYRQAIILTEYRGLTQKQVAESLGLSLSGAKSRVQRAREKLKISLQECCHLDFDRRGNVFDYEPLLGDCAFCSPA